MTGTRNMEEVLQHHHVVLWIWNHVYLQSVPAPAARFRYCSKWIMSVVPTEQVFADRRPNPETQALLVQHLLRQRARENGIVI